MTQHDPRQRYRVRLDSELERGVEGAWERYQNAAALALREPEEWELTRRHPGERISAHTRISAQSLMTRGMSRNEGLRWMENEYRSLEKAVIDAGALRSSIRRGEPVPSFNADAWDIVVEGVYGSDHERLQERLQNFADGVLNDNAEAGAIARAHALVGVEVSEASWRVCANAYADPTRRTPLQLAAYLAEWMIHPAAQQVREMAERERFETRENIYDRRRGDKSRGVFRREYLGRFTDDVP